MAELTPAFQPGKNGGRLRRGGSPGRPRLLPPEFFKPFRDGDKRLGLAPRVDRLAALLTDADPNVRLRAEQLILEHEVGKPTQAVNVAGEGVTVAFIEQARPQTAEEWLDAHSESQRLIAEADQGGPN